MATRRPTPPTIQRGTQVASSEVVQGRTPGGGSLPQKSIDAAVRSGRSLYQRVFARNNLPNPEQVRQSANEILASGLNEYQRKLNSRLLSTLDDALVSWLADYEADILDQLKSVPDHAKETWLEDRLSMSNRRDPENQTIRLLTDFLFQYVQQRLTELERLRSSNQRFRSTIAKVRTENARRKVILSYAADLGATPAKLHGDEKAFDRWFDEEAVTDRFAKKVGSIELLVAFVFDRISIALDRVFQLAYRYDNASPDGADSVNDYQPLDTRLEGIWTRLNVETRVQDALADDGDDRIKTAAIKCLRLAIQRLPATLTEKVLDKRTLVLLHRIAVEARADVWVQCEAISLLSSLPMSRMVEVLRQRLFNPRAGDDMFVRRHIYKLLTRRIQSGQDISLQLPPIEIEPSPFVRQAMATTAFHWPNRNARRHWVKLAMSDESLEVRAAALLVGAESACETNALIDYLQTIDQVLESDRDPFVLRTAMHAVVTVVERVCHTANSIDRSSDVTEQEVQREAVLSFYQQRLSKRITHLERTHEEFPVRRWAAQAIGRCWVCADEKRLKLFQRVRDELQELPIGQAKRFSKRVFAGFDKNELGRILSVLSQSDFGLDIQPGVFSVRVVRGPEFGFRLWRTLFEFSHTATDKRQALRHTVGRINTASMRAPSQICGELSETKVPGEPLTIASDGTWRPFIPLADDFVSVLNRSWLFPRTTDFYTSQGITSVRGPRWLHQRLLAAIKLNFRFASIAKTRNWNDDTYPQNTYIESMRRMGFRVEFQTYACDQDCNAATDGNSKQSREDDSVTSFFTAWLPLLGLALTETVQKHFLRFADYFTSAFENSIEQLLVFAFAMLLLLLGKHAYANYRFRRARRKIPLSIGGWGTRGKSGTERLKAALIGAMGHGLVSKTTGCEAMFIHADPNGDPLEIPLFRPFDKATIWEQYNLILMAAKMTPSVFLWECMALTPSYVDVLSRQWTCDDIATITNTYPDHEDLQGPAGHNVATTISGFVPIGSRLLTTEQQMRPYVSESCRQAGASLRGVGWLESGLITDDVLDRFPYKEHPDNVALVAAMGEEIGVEYDFSLKAMGDYLVPDLGVLKTHPISTVRTRKIEFTNGMSANERFGCMGNIKRLGFDTQDPWQEPTTWVSGVVNNRADRVPRSKVFAKIIVEDMNADRFFLIGNNLKGLMGFIEEAWDAKAATLSLTDQGKPWETEFALATLKQAAWDYRQPITDQHVQRQLETMANAVIGDDMHLFEDLVSQWDDVECVAAKLKQAGVADSLIRSIESHHRNLIAGLEEYRDLELAINEASAESTEVVSTAFIATLRKWYFRKLVVVEKYEASGEEVVARVVDTTPPGFLNRTIGLQNIKGTGLDFVYRFQAWDVCYEACDELLSNQAQTAERGLQTLMSMPAIGQLCYEKVAESIKAARKSNSLRRSDLQAQLTVLDERLKQVSTEEATQSDADMGEASDATNSRSERLAILNKWILGRAEQVADLNDSVRRRDLADLIYQDLADQRISRQRAVVELRKINKRQKGGWLGKKSKAKSAQS